MAGHCVWCFSRRRRDKGKYPSFGRKVFEVIRSSVLWFNCHWSVSNLAVGSFVSMASCRCFGASLKESTVRQFKASRVVSKGFFGELLWWCWNKISKSFPLAAGWNFCRHLLHQPRGSSQAICFTLFYFPCWCIDSRVRPETSESRLSSSAEF